MRKKKLVKTCDSFIHHSTKIEQAYKWSKHKKNSLTFQSSYHNSEEVKLLTELILKHENLHPAANENLKTTF